MEATPPDPAGADDAGHDAGFPAPGTPNEFGGADVPGGEWGEVTERRIDSDGAAYTKEEFFAQYGGYAEWDTSVPDGAAEDSWHAAAGSDLLGKDLPQPDWPEQCVDDERGNHLEWTRRQWREVITDLVQNKPEYQKNIPDLEKEIYKMVEDMNGPKQILSPYYVWMRALTELPDVPDSAQNYDLMAWLMRWYSTFMDALEPDDQLEDLQRQGLLDQERLDRKKTRTDWIAETVCLYYDQLDVLKAELVESYPVGLEGEKAATWFDMRTLDNMHMVRQQQMEKGGKPLVTGKAVDEEVAAMAHSRSHDSADGDEQPSPGSDTDGASPAEYREHPLRGGARPAGGRAPASPRRRRAGFGHDLSDSGTRRSQWLAENARIAHAYQLHKDKGCSCRRMAQAIGLSPGFRIFCFLWLAAGFFFSVVLGWHMLWIILLRMFVPSTTSGFVPTAGLFCNLIFMSVALGSYLSACTRVIEQWAKMGDELYFADQDFDAKIPEQQGGQAEQRDGEGGVIHNPLAGIKRNKYRDNPPANTLFLPVQLGDDSVAWQRTFLNLPTRDTLSLSREGYLGMIVMFTTVIPFFFALIWFLAIGSNSATDMIGMLTMWELNLTMIYMAMYFLYMWYFAMRMKYKSWRRYSRKRWSKDQGHGDDREPDTSQEKSALLHEMAMDERAILRNIVLFLVTCIPSIIAFWIIASYQMKLNTTWVAAALIIIALLLFLREFLRSDSYAHYIPAIAGVMILAFFIIGLVGNVQIGGGSIGVFLALAVMSQFFLIRHRRETATTDTAKLVEEVMEAVERFSDRVGRGDRERRGSKDSVARSSATGGSPSENTQAKKWMRELSKISRRNVKRGKKEDANSEKSLIPCFPCLQEFVSAFACDEKDRKKRTVDPAQLREFAWAPPEAWMGDNGDPAEKLVQSVSLRATIWCFLCFFISIVFVNEFRKELMTKTRLASGGVGVGPGSHDAAAAEPWSTNKPPALRNGYPLCRLRFPEANNLGIVDFAMLADMSYSSQKFQGGTNGNIWASNAGTGRGSFGQEFEAYFGHTDLRLVVYDRYNNTARAPHARQINVADNKWKPLWADIAFLHFYSPRQRQHIIVVRSLLEGTHFYGRDLNVWGDSILAGVLSAVIPLLRWCSDRMMRDFIKGLSFLKQAFDNHPIKNGLEETDFLQPLHKYLDNLEKGRIEVFSDHDDTKKLENFPNPQDPARQNTPRTLPWGPVTIVGHGTNGGLAKIVAARKGLRAVAFSPPGTSWLQEKMNFGASPQNQISVVPTHDVVPKVDKQSGGVQYIKCSAESESAGESMTECHHMDGILCELLRACGDPLGRARAGCAGAPGSGTVFA